MAKGFNIKRKPKMKTWIMDPSRVRGPLTKERMRRIVNAQIKKLQLPETAKDLIRIYNLDGREQSRSLLRHELQRGLLLRIKKRGMMEEHFLSLLNAATTIEHTLWQSEYSGVSLRDALAVHQAALMIADTALKNSKGKWIERWKKTIQYLKGDINRMQQQSREGTKPSEKIEVDTARLSSIARDVDGLMNTIMPKKGYFVRKGFEEADGVARWAFKREQQ